MANSKEMGAENPSPPSGIHPPRETLITQSQVEAIGRELAEPGWVVDNRQQALKVFNGMAYPSPGDREWTRTPPSLFSLGDLELGALAYSGKRVKPPAALKHPLAAEEVGGQIVLCGKDPSDISLADDLRKTGVYIGSIGNAAKEFPDALRKWMGRVVQTEEGKYAALTSAVYETGVFIHVPKGAQITKPIYALLWMPGVNFQAWRTLIVLEEGASLTVLHETASPSHDEKNLRAGIVEIVLDAGATLNFIEYQNWGDNVHHLTNQRAVVQQGSTLHWATAQCGGKCAKNKTDLELAGEGARGDWTGIGFYHSSQHVDWSTMQHHKAPLTASDLNYKVALADSSRSIWNGMILIEPGSSGADGYQVNRNLMLSEKAHADSIPGLEILTDDVRCSHGVSIGELDANEVFYLQSRGILPEDIQALLVAGFFETALERISNELIRRHIRREVEEQVRMGLTTPGTPYGPLSPDWE